MEDKTLGLLLDVVGELFSDEISIAVSNTKEYIYYRPSKRIDLKISVGDTIKEGTIPYHGMAVPFSNNGKLEGFVTAIYPALTDGKSVVTLKTTDGWVPVPFSKVMYLEAKDKKTYVNSEELTGTHKYSLQEFEYLLPKDSFIRCHRSFIVNVNHIKAIYPDTHSTFLLSMDNGERVPVSQSYASYFRKLLGF